MSEQPLQEDDIIYTESSLIRQPEGFPQVVSAPVASHILNDIPEKKPVITTTDGGGYAYGGQPNYTIGDNTMRMAGNFNSAIFKIPKVTIGRDPNNGIVLSNPQISGTHLEIVPRCINGQWSITLEMPTNKTAFADIHTANGKVEFLWTDPYSGVKVGDRITFYSKDEGSDGNFKKGKALAIYKITDTAFGDAGQTVYLNKPLVTLQLVPQASD